MIQLVRIRKVVNLKSNRIYSAKVKNDINIIIFFPQNAYIYMYSRKQSMNVTMHKH